MAGGSVFRRRGRSRPLPEEDFLPEAVPVEAEEADRAQALSPTERGEAWDPAEPAVFGAPSAEEPTEILGTPEEVPFGSRGHHRARRFRLSPVPMFAIAFLFLIGAVTAVGFAQFTDSGIAPWLSIGYSGAAVVCTVVALVLARGR